MKIAVPVQDESLTFFGNAGHTPHFAVFEMSGTGMFKSFKLSELRRNPRTDLDHEHNDDNHECSHAHDDAKHIAEHDKMGKALEDCDYLVVSRACKNTANTMKNHGVCIIKYDGTDRSSEAILRQLAAKF